jgi:hypothetical protein
MRPEPRLLAIALSVGGVENLAGQVLLDRRRPNFFLPVRVLARLFRRLFLVISMASLTEASSPGRSKSSPVVE